ncbi:MULTISPECIES: iron uptake system protein EfeO [unclassified Micromonospora]|uniref:iron uptake system protein EfeO n=1 Tax=unclassified Micromonospora TaxID=2617518 RepID=UPI00188DEECF|nr:MULTISPECIES: iron uptake system protein EfeO [unclassified Micromonospora]MBF5028152.1 cupredoxin domain-containing protein [Micromonospora sp. ANENR4]MCZ7473379.1 cupredoxin domain-containing protein [Micromonospora sp. WMMC273]WBC04039.1 cupredoxin domain-containing protein [Micromonospora sp. WMMA1976]
MRTTRLVAPAAAGLLAVAGLTGCGGGDDADATNGGPIAVKATDTVCEVGDTEIDAGQVTFKVTNNGSKVNEFYVYAAGDRVMGEVENIAPGLSRELRVELTAGTYETACKPGMSGRGIRGALKVSGTAATVAPDAALTQATESYQRYVRSQTAALLTKTEEFVAAVKANDVAKAKALYPVARTYWERIEPVAESFGDLDPKIDGREEVVEEGMEFTGFHRIEKDLWTTGDVSKDGAIADRLLVDVKAIVAKADAEKLTPLQLANGAKALLDEVASGKITGEEERYSHTDLWDFNANLEGSKAAIAALRPALEQRAPDLVKQLDSEFANVETTLGRHRAGDGWKLHTQLGKDELKELSDAVNALAEPVSKVAAAVAR